MTKRAQELFLEVAHYLPEKGARAVVARLQQAVQDALGEVTLDQPLSRTQVLDCLSAVHAGGAPFAQSQPALRTTRPPPSLLQGLRTLCFLSLG